MSSFKEVIQRLKKIPTVNPKSAERIAFNLIKMEKQEVSLLIDSIKNFIDKTSFCSVCGLFSEYNPCRICQSNKRDKSIICIVSKVEDALAIEKSNIYNGFYHVIKGLLSSVNNIFEEDIQSEKIIKRINANIKEIIFAFEEGVEADATIHFLKEKLSKFAISFSRTEQEISLKNEDLIKRLIRERISI